MTQPAAVTRPPVYAVSSLSGHSTTRRNLPSLGSDLRVVFRTYAQAADEVIAEIPAGPRGHKILAAVTHETVGSQVALAEQIGIDPSVLVHVVDDLEEAGLVRRRPDPADRRNRRVVPTLKAHELTASVESRLRRAEDQLLCGLTGAEQSVFRALLARLADDASPRGAAKS
jgi:DNA-binding MarR family transcriptional regulator